MGNENVSRTDSFIRFTLPELLREFTQLDVIVSTYRPFLHYRTGFLPDMPDGLRLMVHTGDFDTENDMTAAAELVASGGDLAGLKERRAERARQSLADTEAEAVAAANLSDAPKLAFVYFGLSAGSAPIGTALVLRRKLGAKVILVSCDCDAQTKEAVAFPHLASGEIERLVSGPSCGGEFDLSTIMNAVIRTWSARRMS